MASRADTRVMAAPTSLGVGGLGAKVGAWLSGESCPDVIADTMSAISIIC
jgi:hypothetical protein